jgi:hypothetical protein
MTYHNHNHDGSGEKTMITDKTKLSLPIVISLLGVSVLVVATWYASANQSSLQAAKEQANSSLQAAKEQANFELIESELSRTITTEQFNEWRELLNNENNTVKVPRLPDRRAGLEMKRPEED